MLEPKLCGGFDASAVHQPRVVATADELTLAYVGYPGGTAPPQAGYAASSDGGMTWTCAWPGPALGSAGLPEGQLHTIASFRRGDRPALLVEWLAEGGTDIWLAELAAG